MKILRYTLICIDRISAGDGSGKGTHQKAYGVIPGNTIRGALAAAWWRTESDRDHFVDLFEQRMVVRSAVPTAGAQLQPLSWSKQKYANDGWVDHASLALQRAEEPSDNREFAKGWHFNPTIFANTQHTALENDGTNKDGSLFSRQSIEAGTTLEGQLILAEGVDEWLLQARTLFIGGRRSVQGRVEFSCEEVEGSRSTLPTREGRIVMRLQSPAILIDKYGSATMDASAAVGDTFGGTARIERQWLRPVQIAGWHGRARLPRPMEWAISAGSTFLLAGLESTIEATAVDQLHRGIGLRTLEGFGHAELFGETGLQSLIEKERPDERVDVVQEAKAQVDEEVLSNLDVDILVELLSVPSNSSATESLLSSASKMLEIRQGGEQLAHLRDAHLAKVTRKKVILDLSADASELVAAVFNGDKIELSRFVAELKARPSK